MTFDQWKQTYDIAKEISKSADLAMQMFNVSKDVALQFIWLSFSSICGAVDSSIVDKLEFETINAVSESYDVIKHQVDILSEHCEGIDASIIENRLLVMAYMVYCSKNKEE